MDSFNALDGSPITYTVAGDTTTGDAAVVYLVPHDKATGAAYPGVIDWAVARYSTGSWAISLPGDAGYTAAYDSLPPDLRRRADSTPYQTAHADVTLTRAVTEYQFPYADSAWATVTRSYEQHGTGRIDFDLSGTDVTAAKDGVIVYASDTHTLNAYATGAWWYWNTVIIQHADHEFSLYGHLEPGSIANWIKRACAADLSIPNCAVPVKAGQVIAREGSTGYSSNPHLHVEFGQGYAVVAYPDTADEDRDGVRAEPVYAGYIYAEQNVPISGSTADEVGAWAYGTLEQAAHGEAPPPHVNLLVNGDFSAGTDGWTASGQLNWSVSDGVLRATRLRTSDPPNWASLHQNVGYAVRAHTPFQATMQLGNASGIPKTITVSIFNRSGRQYGLIECAFGVPANAPLTQYIVQGVAVNTWASARLEISVNPPDGSPAALIDDVELQVDPNVTSDQCITPP